MVAWPSIYSRKLWEYDVALALEAVNEMGFNEINFDYIRMPEWLPSSIETHNKYNETPSQCATEFLRYAVEQIHNAGAYVSGDVFGEISGYRTSECTVFVSGYGQFWPAISNAVDVISSMPYPDHFSAYSFGVAEPWEEPGELMSSWAKATSLAQSVTYDAAKVRTWIQAQSSDTYEVEYGADKIEAQIQALDAQNFDGYMTWNAASSLYRYRLYAGVLN